MHASAPPPRDLAAESANTLQSQIALAPQQYEATAKYAPLYTNLALQGTEQSIFGTDGQAGYLDLYKRAAPGLQDVASQTASQQRTADIADVARLGPEATAALRAANPEQASLIHSINTGAQAGLDAGYNLSPAEQAALQQQVRSGQAGRGFGMGQADATAEAVAATQAGQRTYQTHLQNAQQAVAMDQQTSADPFMAILGRPSQTAGQGQSFLGMGAATAGKGEPGFDPTTAYASDLYNTNYNANAAAQIATANNRAGVLGSALSY